MPDGLDVLGEGLSSVLDDGFDGVVDPVLPVLLLPTLPVLFGVDEPDGLRAPAADGDDGRPRFDDDGGSGE